MKTYRRRSILSALGISLPFGLGASATAGVRGSSDGPALRFRSFETAVREVFAQGDARTTDPAASSSGVGSVRRIEVGDCALTRSGVQGCHNDREFAGFPAGHLRIVRCGSGPSEGVRGVRLYIATVDVAYVGGGFEGLPSRPLDFSALPPAPTLG